MRCRFLQEKNIDQIIKWREQVAVNLRKFITGATPSKEEIIELIKKYGQQDGEISYLYVTAFTNVNNTLTAEQKEKLKALRNLEVYPNGIYIFSDPEKTPQNIDCSSFFSVPTIPPKSLFKTNNNCICFVNPLLLNKTRPPKSV